MAVMEIVERMAASQPAHLGWKPESAVEWGQRICNGITSHIAEVGQQYENLKSQYRYEMSREAFCCPSVLLRQVATGWLSALIINDDAKH